MNEYESKIQQPDRLYDNVVSVRGLKEICIKNLNRTVLGHLNKNALRNKFDILADQVTGNVHVMVISETILNDSFPGSQFKIPRYSSPFHLDRDQNCGGILVFGCEDFTAKFLSFEDKPIEALSVDLNFRKKKWLLSSSFNSKKTTSQTI